MKELIEKILADIENPVNAGAHVWYKKVDMVPALEKAYSLGKRDGLKQQLGTVDAEIKDVVEPCKHQFNKLGECKCGETGTPHHDSDFSYLCGSMWCKCKQ